LKRAAGILPADHYLKFVIIVSAGKMPAARYH